MSFRSLKQLGLLSALACTSASAMADVGLRVESRPILQPIDAYVLVTDGESPVPGLSAGDFSITLDGIALEEFEFSLPPDQDPSQSVSIVAVARTSFGAAVSRYIALLDQLDVGDYVSVVKYWGDMESPRSGGIAILPFTQVDGGAGSDALTSFMQSLSPPGGTPTFFSGGLLAGLREFERPIVSLPDGPKAIMTLDVGNGGSGLPGGSSLSGIIASANAIRIPIFNAGYVSWDAYPDVVANSTALAMNTGGIRVPVADEGSAANALAGMVSWLKNGYRISIPQSAVTDCNPHVLEVAVGGESASISFVRCDTTPEPFEFADLQDVAIATTVVSEPATITGVETAVPVTVIGGEYAIGCGSSYTSEPGWIMPGESVCLRHTTATVGGFEVSTLLIVGGESAWFTSSTIFATPPPPPAPPPAQAGNSGDAGGGGPAGVAELLLLLGLLLARQRSGDAKEPGGLALQQVLVLRLVDRRVASLWRARLRRCHALFR